jgi:hypothetical protein
MWLCQAMTPLQAVAPERQMMMSLPDRVAPRRRSVTVA